jgi:hypothetical protein
MPPATASSLSELRDEGFAKQKSLLQASHNGLAAHGSPIESLAGQPTATHDPVAMESAA